MRTFLAAVLLASSLGACVESPPVDELADESAADGEDGKGDAAAAFTFYTITPDTRACSFNAPPSCGRGFFVARANRSSTQCGIEGSASRCKVIELDWSPTQTSPGLIAEYQEKLEAGEPFLVRGDIVVGRETGTTLKIKELWAGSSAEHVDGVFTLVHDNGLRCIRAPCPSISEKKLNSNLSAQISSLDFLDAEDDEQTLAARDAVYLPQGLIVVGYRDQDGAGGKSRTVNKFFTKVELPTLVR